MSTIDWRSELAEHRLFGDFDVPERDKLLSPSVSKEVAYETGQTILREGEIGDSLFLIGSGEVEICIIGEDRHRIPVATLPEREIFGEMALFESKPRSATVIARRNSVLLKIDGPAFLEILHDHPEVEFKILSKLSERLRRVTDEVLVVKYNDLHKKFELLNGKMNNELDLVRNSITTTETILTATNKRAEEIGERAKEVIEITGRNHDRVFQAIKTVGLVGSIAVIALGVFGYQTGRDVEKKTGEIEDARIKAEGISELIKEVEPLLKGMLAHKDVLQMKYYKYFLARGVLFEELKIGDLESASDTFITLLTLNNDEVKKEVYKQIVENMLVGEERRFIVLEFLKYNIDYLHRFSHKDRFLIYYLLFAAYVMNDEAETADYTNTYRLFQTYVTDYKGDSLKDYFENGFASDLSPKIFREYIEASELEIEFDKLKRNPDGSLDAAEVTRISEDEEIRRRASKRTEKIENIWNRIP